MTKTDNDPRPYRPCVGIMMLNPDNLVFVGNRIDVPGDHWQMPQGGIDPGEPVEAAAMREASEETGVDPGRLEILRISEKWYSYDLPPALSRRIWKGRFKGQTQKWVAMRFDGEDAEIDLNTHKAEFGAWRWVSLSALPNLIVPFKRDLYIEVIEDFGYLSDT